MSVPRTGFRTGQAGQLSRGLHNQGASTYVLSPFIFWYSRVGCAFTVPLLKAAQGPLQPGDLHILSYHLLLFVFLGRVGIHSSTTEGCPGASTTRGPPDMPCDLFCCWWCSRVGWASTCLNPALSVPLSLFCW